MERQGYSTTHSKMAEGIRMPKLPLFLNAKTKYPYGWAMFGMAAFLYVTSNHFHFFPPQYLPMTHWDRSIPLIPDTLWIYISEYFLFAAVYIVSKDYENLNKYLYSFFFMQVLAVTIFWAWPTTYPRDDFPIPTDTFWLTKIVFESLRQTDTPANCCPSLHVSSVFLSSFVYLDEQRKKFPLFFIWAFLVGLSTLTTKQHYIIDVASGLVMAFLFYWIFHKWVKYKPLK